MRKESMSPQERWLAVLQGEKPDRLPMDYWATDEATNKLLKHLNITDKWEMYAHLNIDKVNGVAPDYVGPPLAADEDMYGCRFRDVDYGGGVYDECVFSPLAGYETPEAVAANYTWPSVDWFDFTTLAAQVEAHPGYPVRGGGSEPFLIYKRLRGEEQAYLDLVMNPELVHYCLDQLFDFCYEYTTRIYEQLPGRVLLSYVAEDFGAQTNLLISPKAIATFFLPRMKRMIDLAHSAGAYAFFHSDGAIKRIIPDMIGIGIDILNPIQWRCKDMERQGLQDAFGGQVVFHGAVDNQQTLARGSVDDVAAEVAENIEIFGQNGGYIIAPCHNIQPVSPPENIVTMYRTGLALGWQN